MREEIIYQFGARIHEGDFARLFAGTEWANNRKPENIQGNPHKLIRGNINGIYLTVIYTNTYGKNTTY